RFEAPPLKLQKLSGVFGEYLILVAFRERRAMQPLGRQGVGNERPVDRKQNSVHAHFADRRSQRCVREVSTRGEIEIPSEDILERKIGARTGERLVDAPQEKRYTLTQMSKNNLEIWMTLEQSTDDQPDGLRCGFYSEPQSRADQFRKFACVIAVICVDDGRMRKRWVHINRNIERFGLSE